MTLLRPRLLLRVALAIVLAGVLAVRLSRRAPAPAPPSLPASAVVVSVASGTPPSPRRAASPAELALVAPLAPGVDLGSFAVREIRGVDRGVMEVICAKDKRVVRLEVALVDPEGVVPPATAGRYAIYYSLRGATPEEGELLARKLAAVLNANAAVPPPEGMTSFKPDPKPGTTL